MYVYACGSGCVNTRDIRRLPNVYPNLLSELGDDSGFCNAMIVFSAFPHWAILNHNYLSIIGEHFDKLLISTFEVVVGITTVMR